MIIIDISQLLIANYMVQKNEYDVELSEHIFKDISFRCIRGIKQRFSEYGEVIIAMDSDHKWRKDLFPHYKSKRKKARKDDGNDWQAIHKYISLVCQDIDQFFPYKVINVYGAEGDDVIGALVNEYHEHEEILIVGSDKDHLQLQKYPSVSQYDPSYDRMLTPENGAYAHLREMLIRGDSGDSIPNIFSDSDVFVDGRRQSPVKKTLVQECIEDDDAFRKLIDQNTKNFKRNLQLISYDEIPLDICDNIIEAYREAQVSKKYDLMKYFLKNKFTTLAEEVDQF